LPFTQEQLERAQRPVLKKSAEAAVGGAALLILLPFEDELIQTKSLMK